MCFLSSLQVLLQWKFKSEEELQTSYMILENKVGDKQGE